jgi:integral membrane sensor domain MASE1
VPLLIFVIACCVAAELGQLGAEMSPTLALYWPSTGLVLAVLLGRERRSWPVLMAVAVAAICLSLTAHGWPLIVSALAAAITSLDALLAAALVRWMIGGPFSLDRVSHTATLLLSSLAAPAVGGLIFVGTLSPATISEGAGWLGWLMAEAVGILVTTPLVITALGPNRPLAHIRAYQIIEVASVTAATLVLTGAIFGRWAPPVFRVPAYILPLLLWPAIRFGVGAASVTVFSVCPLFLWYAVQGNVPLAQLGPDDVLLRAHGGILAAASSVLLLASIVSERKRIARERDALVTELQQALAEIKTLRGFIPLCAWCHKVRDDAGFWQEIEHYLDERTDATISHGICPACVEKQTREIEAHEAARSGR